MRRLLALTCLALFAACGEQVPTAPDVTPQFLIGSSPLTPITLDKTDPANPRLSVEVVVNRGITQVAIEDKFFVRMTAEFKVGDCDVCHIDPKDTGVSGQKDTGVRQGSDVGFIMDIDIPAPTWDAIKDLTGVPVEVRAELVMTTGSGSERILDSVTLSGHVDPKDSG